MPAIAASTDHPASTPSCVLGDGERLGRKRVERLMRQAGISGLVKRRRGRTTIRVPGVRVCDDLVDRAFAADGPNRLWVADITYLRTWEGWLYLAAVQDVYSRRIVGWAMADHMRAELVVDALEMALAQRRPAPGLIHHSDQGSPIRLAGLRPASPRRGHRPVDGIARRLLRQRRRRELLRHAQEGTHPPARLADAAPIYGPRSLTTSRSSTTANDATAAWECSRPRSSRRSPSIII